MHKLHSGIDSSFYLNTDSILKHALIVNNLEVSTTVVPLALTNTLIHEFHNCRGHQGYQMHSREDFGGKASKETLSIILAIALYVLRILLTFHVTLNYI